MPTDSMSTDAEPIRSGRSWMDSVLSLGVVATTGAVDVFVSVVMASLARVKRDDLFLAARLF